MEDASATPNFPLTDLPALPAANEPPLGASPPPASGPLDFDVIVEAPAEDTADANIGAASAGITDYERERILYSSLRRASNKTQNKLTNLWLFVS